MLLRNQLCEWQSYINSLVPRLPCFGTQTLKLCRRGEPGIFSHVSSAKGQGIPETQNRKKKVAANLLHVSSYQRLNIMN